MNYVEKFMRLNLLFYLILKYFVLRHQVEIDVNTTTLIELIGIKIAANNGDI
jgi:hypothetical protein